MEKLTINMKMKLTRKDLVKASLKRPLHKLRWQDIMGTMAEFSRVDVVWVSDKGKTRIMKDRQGDYLHLPCDERGLVDTALLSNAPAHRPGGERPETL